MTLSRMRKRMSEIGVRKAFGATANVLLRQVFYENLLLTLIAGAVGMLFSYACTFLLNDFLFSNSENRAQIGETSLSADMLFSPWIFLAAFIFCLLLNLLSASMIISLGRPLDMKNVVNFYHAVFSAMICPPRNATLINPIMALMHIKTCMFP